MRLRMMLVALVVLRCGFTPVAERPDRVCDAGPPPDAGLPPDAGGPVISTPLPPDPGISPWCATVYDPCWGDGVDYDIPGHCCMSRMTCFGLDAGTPGYCAY